MNFETDDNYFMSKFLAFTTLGTICPLGAGLINVVAIKAKYRVSSLNKTAKIITFHPILIFSNCKKR